VEPNLSHGLANERSRPEEIQTQLPRCRMVKAFTIHGREHVKDSAYPAAHVKPVRL
jgi:predicted dinucleotide-binding enzyme